MTQRTSGVFGLVIAMAFSSVTVMAQQCPGDCDDSGDVTVNEVLTMVNIGVGTLDVAICPAGDLNHDNAISIDEILVAVNSALSGCPGGPRPTPTPLTGIAGELAATGAGAFLGITPSSMTQRHGWDEYSYDASKEDAICLHGGPYQVNIHRGTSDKVLLYLEGGGACWEYVTCASGAAKPTANSAEGAGILDFTQAANPFTDWNIVYAPYCDGSVFSGNNIVDYTYQGNTQHTYHHGIQNLSAAVALMKREFPNAAEILVSGSSAGGYGTFQGYGITRIAFPTTPITVFDDSGPGLQNPDDTVGVEARIANWNYRQYVPPSCTDCDIQLTYLSDWAMDRDPLLRTALYSYLQDMVIRGFLNLDGPHYETILRATTDDIHQRHPDRFKRFFKHGAGHTVLELPNFYTLSVNGTVVRDWTVDFLTNSPQWQDVIDQ
jgi:hypothetical protein